LKLFETTAGTYSGGPRGRVYSAILLSFHGGGREDEEVFKYDSVEVALFGKGVGRFENANEDGAEFAFADTEPLQESGGLSRSADVGWNLESRRSQISKSILPWSPEVSSYQKLCRAAS
jgi:hypothetical protein